MEQLGPIATYVVFAYGFGFVWYHILDRPVTSWLRMPAYPLLGIILGEGLWATYLVSGPAVLGIHVVVALFATFAAVLLDVLVETGPIRKPIRYMMGLRVNVNVDGREQPKAPGALAESRR
ncbi:MAG: hypothetical protein ACE5JL_01710 [Dehalococcoidia bacterium]